MTDEQIIKAFEEILKNQNNKLSLIERAVCDDVLSLANRQKAEIEELRSDKIIAETHEKAAKDLFVDCAKQREEAKAEIKRLTDLSDQLGNDIDIKLNYIYDLEEKIETAKSEAIKEFAERLKEKADDYVLSEGEFETMLFADDIDNLVKEMTEVEE